MVCFKKLDSHHKSFHLNPFLSFFSDETFLKLAPGYDRYKGNVNHNLRLKYNFMFYFSLREISGKGKTKTECFLKIEVIPGL